MKHLLIAGLLLLGASSVLPAEEPIPAKVILQPPRTIEPEKKPNPWLIPTRLLEIPFDQWSAANRDRAPRKYLEKFNEIVEEVRVLGASGNCMPGKGIPQKSSLPKPGEPRYSIFEVAGTTKNILQGEVVATEPAWDPVTLQIYTLVHLRIQRIVRGLEPINVGEIVTYRRPWGSVTVRGVTLCSHADGMPASPPRPGKEAAERLRPAFLILGRLVPGNGLFINTNDFEEFQVIDGLAYYPPGQSFYRDNKPENLEELLSRFHGSSQ